MAEGNLIHILGKRLALHQAPSGFRTSMDSVMLAASCPIKEGETLLDIGCGVGGAGFCVLKRVKNTKLIGIDIQQDHIELAIKNAAENKMTDYADFVCGDVREITLDERYDHVICNPPYMKAGAHVQSPSKAKAHAMGHLEEDQDLQSWVSCAHRHIKGQGSLSIIHDAGNTDTIIHALFGRTGGRRFGAIEIIPLFPRAGDEAKRVIIRAYKHKKSKTTLYPGIIMHQANGDYTKEADHILRDAAPLL